MSGYEKAALAVTLFFIALTAGIFIGTNASAPAVRVEPSGAAGQNGGALPAFAPSSPETSSSEPSKSQTARKIDLNGATVEELCELPGIGPAIAERIVAYREQNGPFSSPEELLFVSGIGEKKLADLLPCLADIKQP